MNAAIYARKSTDQTGASDENRSVTRQLEHARAYARQKGWRVADDHVFTDDGISGAEFAARPGFVRLMNALKPRPAFQILIMSEESRLGREQIETAYALKQIVQAGVRVFFYLEDCQRTFDSPTDKLLLSVTAFADELEREKARQRTYDALVRKARAGHVTGGRVFGYENVDVLASTSDGRQVRSHVERRIVPAEAAVVRRIFELYASGHGLKRIVRQLNAEAAQPPQPQRQRPRAWAPSSVHGVLHRELYHGELVWNRSRKRDAWGQRRAQDRPESQWLRQAVPELQIVSDELWAAVQARQEKGRETYTRSTNGQLHGRPVNSAGSKYLLPGFSRCRQCEAGIYVRTRDHGKQRVPFYAAAITTAASATTTLNSG